MKNKITTFIMLVIFCFLTLFDYLSTLVVLNNGGIEINPIAALAFESDKPGFYGLLYKLFTIVFVFAIYTIFKRAKRLRNFTRIVLLVNIALTLAVINNFWWSYYLCRL